MTASTPANTKLLSVVLGEDAWAGDANAIVSVDGVVVFSGAVTAAEQSAGQTIKLGAFDATVDHKVSVQFTNDSYGGTATMDRNLYVKDVLVDGVSTSQSKALYNNGTATFDAPASAQATSIASPLVVGSGPDTVQVSVSEDAWQGDAQFAVLVDGQQVGGIYTATASHASGQDQIVDIEGSFGSSPHTVGLQFLNDAFGGGTGLDRNLYVDAVGINGVNLGATSALYVNGTTSFAVQAPTSLGTGPDTISIVTSEDAWQGDALMTVSVDGTAIGAPIAVTASHAAGASETFLVNGAFGSGSHTVSVAFTNDAYGGTAATDRNLYVQSVAVNGQAVAGAAGALYSNGAVSGTATFGTAAPPATLVPATPTPVVNTSVPTPAPAATPVPTVPPAPKPTPPVVGANANVGLVPVGTPVYASGATIETVGVGKEFTTIGAAVAAATDGTVILVDAGTYTNDFATNYAKVSLIAVGGRVHDVATAPPPNWKGLFTTENDLTLIGFDVEGVHIPDAYGHNGAGIRDDSGNLVLENDEFSNNQDGILTNSGSYSITIDHSVFNDNGGNDGNGAGNIHNVYIGDIASVTATNSIFENAQVGHEFKSRANVNTLTNNQFISGVGIGTGSYDIDLPDGGKDTVTGNTIIKGPNAENNNILHFGGEGIPYAGSSLTVSGNLFESDGSPNAIAVLNQTSITAQINGNVFANIAIGSIAQGPANITNDFDGSGNAIQNMALVGVLPGSTYIATDALAHTVALDGQPFFAAQGGAGLLTVLAEHGHVIAIGGSGGMNVVEGSNSGADQYTTAAGSTNVLDFRNGGGGNSIDSEGNDTIYCATLSQTGQLNGNATVFGSPGNNYWSVGGTAAIDTGSGATFVTVGATATVALTGTNGYFQVSSNGGNASWNTTNSGIAVVGSASVGAFSMEAHDGTMHVTTTAGSTGVVLSLDQGDAQVISLGPDTIYAGAGNDVVTVSGAAKVYAGTGSLTVFGHGEVAGADVYGGAGDYTIAGDSGGITYHGGTAASTVEATLSNIAVDGGAGRLTINGGSRDTVVGGAGGIVYNDFGNGANTISTATGSSNVLNLSGTDQVQSLGTDTITLDSGNSYFALKGNSSLTLEGGNSQVDLFGTDLVTTLAGYDNLTVHAGASLTLVSSNLDQVSEAGGKVAVTFTDPNAGTVSSAAVSGAGSASVSTAAGTGIAIATSGDAPVTITTNGGVMVSAAGNTGIHLGSGTDTLNLGGTGNEVWAGSGTLFLNDMGNAGGSYTLHGGSGAITAYQPNSHVEFLAGSGSAMLTGGDFDIVGGSGSIQAQAKYGVHINSFVGGSGSASLSLDNNAANIVFGSGHTTVQELGYGAVDTFNFLAGMNGTDTIANFRVGMDKMVLGQGVHVTSSAVVGGSAQFALDNGAHLTLTGVGSTSNVFG